MPRTALVVPVPEAEPAVGELRLAHDWSAARGVPAHVTILFPFVDGSKLDAAAVADVLDPFAPFDFALVSVERFEQGPVWLRPEPAKPFLELIHAVWRRFPEHPPYGGAYATVVPHLTVSDEPLEFEVKLPIACGAREVLLLEEGGDGGWRTRRSFVLQGVA